MVMRTLPGEGRGFFGEFASLETNLREGAFLEGFLAAFLVAGRRAGFFRSALPAAFFFAAFFNAFFFVATSSPFARGPSRFLRALCAIAINRPAA
jgi:hypothetical protein